MVSVCYIIVWHIPGFIWKTFCTFSNCFKRKTCNFEIHPALSSKVNPKLDSCLLFVFTFEVIFFFSHFEYKCMFNRLRNRKSIWVFSNPINTDILWIACLSPCLGDKDRERSFYCLSIFLFLVSIFLIEINISGLMDEDVCSCCLRCWPWQSIYSGWSICDVNYYDNTSEFTACKMSGLLG